MRPEYSHAEETRRSGQRGLGTTTRARRVLALDMGAHALKATLLEQTFRGGRVLACYYEKRDSTRPLAEQLQTFAHTYDLRAETVLSCLPGDAITHRVLTLPFTRPHQIAQTVPFELESQLPFSLEDVLVDFQMLRRTAEGMQVLAVAVPRMTLADHLETLAQAGLDPAVVSVAPLAPLVLLELANTDVSGTVGLLDIGENRTSLVLLRDGRPCGIRTLSVGLSRIAGFAGFMQELRWTLLALEGRAGSLPHRFFLCGGGAQIASLRSELSQALQAEILPFHALDLTLVPQEHREKQGVFAVCLGLGLREVLGRKTPNINLRREGFAYQGKRDTFRRQVSRLGWLAAGVGLLAGVTFGLDLHRLSVRYDAVRQEVRRIFTETMPEVRTIVNEKMQLQDAIDTLQRRQRALQEGATISPLELLRRLSLALPRQVTLDLNEWVLDEKAVQLRGTTDSFDTAEHIKNAVVQLDLFREVQLKDVKTAPGGKKVSFSLHLVVSQEGV